MNLKDNCSRNNKNKNYAKRNSTVYELIKLGLLRLKDANIQNAFNESFYIMKYVLKKTPEETIMSYGDKIAANKINLFERFIERRSKREPLAYIVNKKEFYSLDFFVGKSVLIPRPDTECLVDEAIQEIKRLSGELRRKIRVLDIGTGSGAIAISIAKNSDNVIIYAADNSKRSLYATRKNIIANAVGDKVIPVYFNILTLKTDISFKGKDFNNNFDAVDYAGDFDNFDIIISNPPYIETGDLETLEDDIKLYEPLKALDGGKDGLKFYRIILDAVSLKTKNKKAVILEIDYRKKNQIQALFNEKFKKLKFKNITFISDLNYKERAVKITYG